MPQDLLALQFLFSLGVGAVGRTMVTFWCKCHYGTLTLSMGAEGVTFRRAHSPLKYNIELLRMYPVPGFQSGRLYIQEMVCRMMWDNIRHPIVACAFVLININTCALEYTHHTYAHMHTLIHACIPAHVVPQRQPPNHSHDRMTCPQS